MVRSFKLAVGSIFLLGVAFLATPANATPVSLTGSYSSNGDSISGNLQGDYTGNVLTINSSMLSIDLATSPLQIPHPIYTVNGPFCGGFECTINAYLNEHITHYSLSPWNFSLEGTVEFDSSDPFGATANLTATPLGSFAYLTGTAAPTFSVTATNQNSVLAKLAASGLEAALNLADFSVDIFGSGYWDSIDPLTIIASSTENAGLTELALTLNDMTLNGIFNYNEHLAFNNSIVNSVGSAFISNFGDAIDDSVTSALVNQFNSLRLGSIEDDNFAIDCSALQIGYRTASLSCVADASFEGSFGTPSPAPVTEPATLWLFGLGLAGVVGFRRRRSGA